MKPPSPDLTPPKKRLGTATQTDPIRSQPFAILFLGLAALIIGISSGVEGPSPLGFLGISVGMALSLYAITLSAQAGWASLGAMLAAFTIVFHLGALASQWLGWTASPIYAQYFQSWLTTEVARTASFIAAFVIAAFASGYSLAARLFIARARNGVSAGSIWVHAPVPFPGLGIAGLAVALAGFVLLLISGVAVGDYRLFNQAANSGVALGQVFVAMGGAIAIASGHHLLRSIGAAVLGAFAILMLGTGSRTWVFIALALAVVGYAASDGRRPSPRWLWGVPIVLAAAAVTAALRSSSRISVGSFNPVAALEEFGGSLRPLVETIRWLEQGQLAVQGPSLYTGWLAERLGGGDPQVLSGSEFLAQQVRGLNLAYSNVADLTLSFGVVGALTVAFFAGVLIAYLDRAAFGTRVGAVWLVALAVPLLYTARQSARLMLPQLMIGLAIATVVVIAGKLLDRPGRRTMVSTASGLGFHGRRMNAQMPKRYANHDEGEE